MGPMAQLYHIDFAITQAGDIGGIVPLDDTIRIALLQILEDRYDRRSIIITSQLPFSIWYEYLGEPTLADAIMDRLTAGAHKLELKGESLRKRKKNK